MNFCTIRSLFSDPVYGIHNNNYGNNNNNNMIIMCTYHIILGSISISVGYIIIVPKNSVSVT